MARSVLYFSRALQAFGFGEAPIRVGDVVQGFTSTRLIAIYYLDQWSPGLCHGE